MKDHDFDEFADYTEPARPAVVHDLEEFDQAAPAAAAAPITASGLPRQTGKRFIEPPDDEPAPPSLMEQQIAALGVAPSNRHKTFPTPREMREQLQVDKATIANRPQLPERIARNVSQGIPLIGPYSDEVNAALYAPLYTPSLRQLPETYRQIRDASRARDAEVVSDHPIESGATRIAASLVPTGALLKGASTAGQVALRALGIGAAEGLGRSEADLTKGQVEEAARDAALSGALSGATAGTVAKIIRGAPERVDARMMENISRGEAGGSAGNKIANKLAMKAGDSDEPVGVLNEVLTRFPGLKSVLVTQAAGAPAKAAAAVQEHVDVLNGKLAKVYEEIDKGGGTRLIDLVSSVDKMRRDLLAQGNVAMAGVADKFRNTLIDSFGTGGKVPQQTRIAASALRNLRNEVGQIAFGPDPAAASTSFAIKAQQRIYGALNGAIEQAGAAAGVDVAKLRQLNSDDSMLLAVLAPLKARAARAATGGSSLYANLLHAGGATALAGAGFTHGGAAGALEGAVTAAALIAAKKATAPIAKATDYQLGRLILAARAGSTPAQLGQAAAELGLSRAVGEKLARTILPPPDDDAQAGDMPPEVARRALGGGP